MVRPKMAKHHQNFAKGFDPSGASGVTCCLICIRKASAETLNSTMVPRVSFINLEPKLRFAFQKQTQAHKPFKKT